MFSPSANGEQVDETIRKDSEATSESAGKISIGRI